MEIVGVVATVWHGLGQMVMVMVKYTIWHFECFGPRGEIGLDVWTGKRSYILHGCLLLIY